MKKDNNTKKKVKTNNNNIEIVTFRILMEYGSSYPEKRIDISKMSDDMKIFHFNKCVFYATMYLPKMPGFTMSHLFNACSIYYNKLFDKPYHNMEDWMAITVPFNLNLLMAIPLVKNKSCGSKIIGLMNEYCDKNATTIDVRQKELMESPNFESDYIKCFS